MVKYRKEESKREKQLIEVATRQFIEKGYGKTSVRSIVREVGGEIGMFYHYFSSKEDIFKVVIKTCNRRSLGRFKALVQSAKESRFEEVVELALKSLDHSITAYKSGLQSKTHNFVLVTIHQHTLKALRPYFMKIIEEYVPKEGWKLPDMDRRLLGDFLLYGMSAVVHNTEITNSKEKQEAILALVGQLFRS